jgi:excisionase family DNA binding protein
MNKYQYQETDKVYYMNVTMVSEYLHVAKSTIYKWVDESYIPYKKLGKRLLFIKWQIDEWVLNDGVIVKDLPDAPRFIKLEKDKSELTQGSVSNKLQSDHQANFRVKYRTAG